jgi:hypothetical protein
MSLLLATGSAGQSTTVPLGYSDSIPLGSQVHDVYAVNPGDSIPDAQYAAIAATPGRPPGMWSMIILEPGDHVGQQVGMNGDHPMMVIAREPGATTVTMPLDGGFSTINTWGGTWVVAGINFVLPEGVAGSGAYALHHHSGRMGIFEKCTFRSLSTSRASAAGADTDPRTSTFLIDCEFYPGPNGVATNFHGWPNNSIPSRYVFHGCSGPMLGYSADNHTCADEVWITGPGEVGSWGVYGAQTRAYVRSDISAHVGADPVTEHVTYLPVDALPPLPLHGYLPS